MDVTVGEGSSGFANEGSSEEGVGVGDLGKDEDWVRVGGDVVVGKATKDMGDQVATVMKVETKEAVVGFPELAEADDQGFRS